MLTDQIGKSGAKPGLFGRISGAVQVAATAYANAADDVRKAEAGFMKARITGVSDVRPHILDRRDTRRARREARLG
ncbi:MAG: hypothetical protein AAF719_13270 [Pseudomonadota bacterium]